jgi:hypothetical protein
MGSMIEMAGGTYSPNKLLPLDLTAFDTMRHPASLVQKPELSK